MPFGTDVIGIRCNQAKEFCNGRASSLCELSLILWAPPDCEIDNDIVVNAEKERIRNRRIRIRCIVVLTVQLIKGVLIVPVNHYPLFLVLIFTIAGLLQIPLVLFKYGFFSKWQPMHRFTVTCSYISVVLNLVESSIGYTVMTNFTSEPDPSKT